MKINIFLLPLPYKITLLIKKTDQMNATAEILKNKIENLNPEMLETFAKMVKSLEMKNKTAISQFYLDEILYRIQFHRENPDTKLDFYENISELKKYCA